MRQYSDEELIIIGRYHALRSAREECMSDINRNHFSLSGTDNSNYTRPYLESELARQKIALAALTATPVNLPDAFYGVVQAGKVVMLPADDGQWLNKTTVAESFRAAGYEEQ